MPPRGFPPQDNRPQQQLQHQQHNRHHIPSQQQQQQSLPQSEPQYHQYSATSSLSQHNAASASTHLQSSSTSSLRHALDMPYPQMQQHEAHYDDSHAAASSSSSHHASVWLHSTQQPVTDDELNAFLATKPWKVDMDESYEEMLSLSLPAPPWPPARSSSRDDGLWSGPQPQPYNTGSTYYAAPGHNRMQFSMTDAISAPNSVIASLSPSSYTNSPFRNTSLDPNTSGMPSNNTHDINQYTHSSSSVPQSLPVMPFNMTPHTYSIAQLAHDSLSSPEDNLLQSLHRRQNSSTASLSSPESHVSQVSSRRQHPRMLHRQSTSSSASSSSSLQSNLAGTETRGLPMTPTTSSERPLASQQQLLTANRSRAGVLSTEMRPRLSTSSASSGGTMDKIQESSAMTFATGITTSLSAELAGLGLNVADFPMGNEADGSFEMQRKDSSSSSSSTRTRRATNQEQTESSFLSQATSSLDSSGLDDSLLSLKSSRQNSSRWIHGKDTPPSSPAPSFGRRSRPSPMFDQNSLAKLSAASAASLHSSSSPYSRSDEFGVVQSKSPGSSSLDWSNTWPRASMQSNESTLGVTTGEASPLPDSRRGRFVPSPSTRSLHDSRSKRHSRGYSSTLSLETIDDGRGIRNGSRIMKASNESLQSDIGPSRSSRPMSENKEGRRMKRMSASFVSEQEARRLHQEKQRQYDQVSDALDTLRRFLRQRDDDGPLSSSSRSTLYAGGIVPSPGEQVSSMLAESSQSRFADDASSSRRQRTLRHPPTGPLPPRGSIFVSPQAHSPKLAIPAQEGLRVEAERMAALEDLAKRVRQMKDENEQMLEDL